MRYTVSVQSFSKNNLKHFYQQLNYVLNKKIFLKNSKKNFLFQSKMIFLPSSVKKFTLNKAPHIDKKAREQFETRIYKSVFIIKPSIPLTKKSFLILFFILKKAIKTSISTSLIKSKFNFEI